MSVNTANNVFYLADQTAKGSAATAADGYFMEWLSGDIRPEVEHGRLITSDGDPWGGGRNYVNGVVLAEDTVRFVLSPQNGPAIATWLLGTDAITGASDPYTHTITPASTSPYLTAWRMVDDEWMQMNDLKVQQWAIGAANDGEDIIAYIELTVVVLELPQYLDAAPASLPSRESDAYTFWDGTGAYAVDAGGGSEAAVDNITNWRVQASKNMSTPKGEDYTPYDAFEGRGEVEVAFDLLATDHVLEFIHMYGSATPSDTDPMATDLVTGSINFKLTAQAAPARSIMFDCGQVEYRPEKVVIEPDNDAAEQAYRMVGDARGSDPIITVTALNDVATSY